ncbi:MAG: hypothetical protein HN341_05535 [Verrucomicrobia bacterium]|nr:hypothetical protein [Verrucomicrobiota bacterium]
MMRLLGLAVAVGLACTVPASAGKLVLRIHAAHKGESPQPVTIRTSLPARISTNDIVNLNGLNLGYDVKSDTYYVYDTVEVAAGEIKQYNVEMNDIWVVDEEELASYKARSGALAAMLAGTKSSTDGDEEHADVLAREEEILLRQSENGIAAVENPIIHIQAYETNLKAFQEIKQSVGRLENLALAEGLNPGDALIGDDRSAAIPRRDVHFPKEFGEAWVNITVHNSSATRPRQVDIRRDMPPEISIDDVLDAGGLLVRYDPKAHSTYVFKNDIEVQPLETLTFRVKIRDKWNINAERMTFLQEKVNSLFLMTSGRASIEAVESTLNGALEALEAIMKERGPETLSPAYIAFYRRQADRLDDVERDLNRVDSALKPLETKRGFDIPAPDKKTTWLIIYMILGFLALVSLLFFLRWFVRSS